MAQRQGLTMRYMGKIASPWDEICIAHMLVVVHSKDNNPEETYKEQATLTALVCFISRRK